MKPPECRDPNATEAEEAARLRRIHTGPFDYFDAEDGRDEPKTRHDLGLMPPDPEDY